VQLVLNNIQLSRQHLDLTFGFFPPSLNRFLFFLFYDFMTPFYCYVKYQLKTILHNIDLIKETNKDLSGSLNNVLWFVDMATVD
jgi:hypothetical protein